MIFILLALAAAQASGHAATRTPAQAGPLDIRTDRLQRCIALAPVSYTHLRAHET